MTKQEVVIRCCTEKTVLSGISRIFKTERFMKDTRKIAFVDDFLTTAAEGIFPVLSEIGDKGGSFLLKTDGGEHTLFFRFGSGVSGELPVHTDDIIFYRYIDREKHARTNDQRFADYLAKNKTFFAALSSVRDEPQESDFKKLYRLSNADGVNFPLLNDEQKKIVMTEDKNMLVQGVAGSGKTNICIDKIIFAACRAYAGRVLYSTYSRGLLIDTKKKVTLFAKNLSDFVQKYKEGKVVFCDGNHKTAVENKLGILFDVDRDEDIIAKTESVIKFLDTQVDYFLLEDLYRKYVSDTVRIADESYFLHEYIGSLKNYRLAGKLEKIKSLSYEVIYKEIFGMIFGSYRPDMGSMLTEAEYIESRKADFGKTECEVIYSIANDYGKYLEKNNLIDNNGISRTLLKSGTQMYSLAVLDEVQDFTQVNLALFKALSFRMFCVGDALQMINPSYFGFSYLKRLLFKADEASVAELKHNYRNSEKIEEIIERLGEINISQFGTHSFVLKGKSVESDVQTSTVYVHESGFLESVAKENFDNFTVICSGTKEKAQLRTYLKKQEILTVSEIKGLERDAVVLYNVLSDNRDKWRALARSVVNRKQADENSVYRYYFNLFYVGVSRARQYLYVVEEDSVPLFEEFFNRGFERKTVKEAIEGLGDVVRKIEIDQDEIYDRITRFINLEQYDNARFLTAKVEDDAKQREFRNRIDVHEEYIKSGNYREAGIRFWEFGMLNDAKQQFMLSGDKQLADLVDAVSAGQESYLDPSIVDFYPELEDNDGARTLILRVLQKDLARLTETQKDLNKKLKKRSNQ